MRKATARVNWTRTTRMSMMAHVPCQVCDNPLRAAYPDVLDVESGEHFALLRCAECGLGHTSPAPSDVGRYYGARYHGGRHGLTARLAVTRRLRWVKQLAQTPGRALDVGCGEGSFLLALKARGWQVAGTELQPELAQAAGLPVASNVSQAAALGAPFDLVTLWHSLEHLPAPRDTLRTLVDLLAPHGILIAAVPNAEGLQARLFGRHWLHLDVPRHLFHFGPTSLARLLTGAGLHVSQRWDEELEYDALGWIQSTLDAVGGKPRLLFDTLRGVRGNAPLVATAAHLMAGACLLPAALLATLAGDAMGAGGTLVMAAERRAMTRG